MEHLTDIQRGQALSVHHGRRLSAVRHECGANPLTQMVRTAASRQAHSADTYRPLYPATPTEFVLVQTPEATVAAAICEPVQ